MKPLWIETKSVIKANTNHKTPYLTCIWLVADKINYVIGRNPKLKQSVRTPQKLSSAGGKRK